jgi:hypothetical protein
LHNSFNKEDTVERLATRYVRLQNEMRKLRSGEALAAAVDAVERELPSEPVVLISTSDEGAGLAAACAVRLGRAARWMKVDLLAAEPVLDEWRVVVVEPVDAGAAWRQAVERAYPGARVLILSELLVVVPVAA